MNENTKVFGGEGEDYLLCNCSEEEWKRPSWHPRGTPWPTPSPPQTDAASGEEGKCAQWKSSTQKYLRVFN